MTAPLVSIILRPNNHIKQLYQALLSIYAQTYRPLEIIIVKNGGSDFSSVIEKAVSDIPHHYIYNESSRGEALAAGLGIGRASGELLMFLGANDILYPNHIEKLVGIIKERDAKVAYSSFNLERCIWEGDTLVPEYHYPHHRIDFNTNWLYFENFLQQSTVIFSRSLYDEIGGVDHAFASCEDWDLWIRFAQQVTFARLPLITCECRQTADKLCDDMESYRRIYQKYQSFWSVDIVLDYVLRIGGQRRESIIEKFNIFEDKYLQTQTLLNKIISSDLGKDEWLDQEKLLRDPLYTIMALKHQIKELRSELAFCKDRKKKDNS